MHSPISSVFINLLSKVLDLSKFKIESFINYALVDKSHYPLERVSVHNLFASQLISVQIIS